LILTGSLTATLGLSLPAAADPLPGTVRLSAGTLRVLGTGAADAIAFTRDASTNQLGVDFDADGLPEVRFDESRITRVLLSGRAGNDRLSTAAVPATIAVTVYGGEGDDLLLGGDGAERFHAGSGNDSVFGGRGNDRARLGSGDDRFGWAPGDGNDRVDGQSGSDTQLFLGSGADESVRITANGHRVRFFRDVGQVTMDLNRVEILDTDLLTGTDSIDVGNLGRTHVREVVNHLGNNPGSQGRITVSGTPRVDQVDVLASVGTNGSTAYVLGLPVQVTTDGAGVEDRLQVRLGDGDDKLSSSVAAGTLDFTADGQAGDDQLLGGDANETFIGGSGSDVVQGGRGADTARLGSGELDLFIWDPGEGSDVVDGGSGTDVLVFRGSNAAEQFTLNRTGRRESRFTRDLGNIVMDLRAVEVVDLTAMGGADNLAIGDLTGSGVQHVAANLSVVPGGSASDAAVDSVTVAGTARNDRIVVTGQPSGTPGSGTVAIEGLPVEIGLTRVEPTDQLTVNGLGGLDTVDTAGLIAGTGEFRFNQ